MTSLQRSSSYETRYLSYLLALQCSIVVILYTCIILSRQGSQGHVIGHPVTVEMTHLLVPPLVEHHLVEVCPPSHVIRKRGVEQEQGKPNKRRKRRCRRYNCNIVEVVVILCSSTYYTWAVILIQVSVMVS